MKYQSVMRRVRLNDIMQLFVLFLLGINFVLYAFLGNHSLSLAIRGVSVGILFFVYVYQRSFSKSSIILLAIAIFLIFRNGDVGLNIAFLIILGIPLNTIEEKSVYMWMNYVNVFISVIVIICLASGAKQNLILVNQGRVRMTLGFEHPNFAGMFCYSVASTFLLSRKDVKLKNLIIVGLVAFMIYYCTNSRTGFMATLFMMGIFLLTKVLPNRIIKVSLCVLIFFCFLTPFMWRLPFFNSPAMNSMLSLRPYLFNSYIGENGLLQLLLGGSRAGEVDSFYLLLLYNSGILIYVFFLCLQVVSIVRLSDAEEYIKLAVISGLLITGILESSMLRPELLCMPVYWMILFRPILNSRRVVQRNNIKNT